ncbi:hypothetical protein FRC07_014724, partial [Ceratobasidium sp. 392]
GERPLNSNDLQAAEEEYAASFVPFFGADVPHFLSQRQSTSRADRPKEVILQGAAVIKTNLFALIIGIDAYPKLKQLTGAVADAKAMRDHLIIDLNVPPENITTLLDASATRSAILQNFKALQTNPRIRKGAPILIFFAGHGGLGTASQKCMDKYGHKEIQVIFPYDYEPKYPGPTPKDRNCIPDTTIRALLNGLAKERGNNIVRTSVVYNDVGRFDTSCLQTVILDSCYSASGDRTHTVAGRIARDAEVEVEVSCDIDVDVTSPALLAELQSSKDSRSPQLPLHTDQASHVLLAAAGSHQKAWEESRRGNFTKEFLAGIRAVGGAHKITYENLITSLRKLPGE